ncbi:MAG: YeiH family protein [Acidobacteriota bacterium]
MEKHLYAKITFILLIVLCILPFVPAPLALLLGIAFSLLTGNPFQEKTGKITHKLLQYSVIGLGFGMNALAALDAGKRGLIYTVAGIAFTFTFGFIISRILKVDSKTSYLISAGTAICGGSAIAAVAPVINAKNENTSVALGVVFILNSIALLVFPAIGHHFHLTEGQFGLWSAIAIHDTSSVVGASSQYGKTALATATTIKLARALWIIPVALASGLAFRSDVKKVKIPYFIIAFFIAMLLNTYLPVIAPVSDVIYQIAKRGLVVTLFLIGANLSRKTLKTVGVRPFVMGVLLWLAVSSITLFFV